MSDFNFEDVKVTVAKVAPKQTRVRLGAPNPFAAKLEQSLAKADADGNGQWLQLTLPGKAETTDQGRTHYGEVVKKAMNLIASAASAMGKGSDRHVADNEDGTVVLSFRARERRAKVSKTENKA